MTEAMPPIPNLTHDERDEIVGVPTDAGQVAPENLDDDTLREAQEAHETSVEASIIDGTPEALGFERQEG